MGEGCGMVGGGWCRTAGGGAATPIRPPAPLTSPFLPRNVSIGLPPFTPAAAAFQFSSFFRTCASCLILSSSACLSRFASSR